MTIFMMMLVVGFTSAAGEIALSAILGVVGTFITQFIKTRVGTTGNSALILTVVVSTVLGFIAAFSVGQWDGADVVGSTGIVFSLATIAYRFFLSNDAEVTIPVIDDTVNNDGL